MMFPLERGCDDVPSVEEGGDVMMFPLWRRKGM